MSGLFSGTQFGRPLRIKMIKMETPALFGFPLAPFAVVSSNAKTNGILTRNQIKERSYWCHLLSFAVILVPFGIDSLSLG